MRKHHKFMRRILLMAVLAIVVLQAWGVDVVTLHSSGAGQLKMTREALVAKRLKVTGHIDARDFKTMKVATISVTQELDLSEAVIEGYEGLDGCKVKIGSNYIVSRGDYYGVYPPRKIPLHAFTSNYTDNASNSRPVGSFTLEKLILPADCEGIEADGLLCNEHIAIDLPENSTTAEKVGIGIYNKDVTKLIAVDLSKEGILSLPETVTSVADSLLCYITLQGIEIKGGKVNFGKQIDLSVGYVITDTPSDYAETFPNADIMTPEQYAQAAIADNATEGTLMEQLGNSGWTFKTLRNLTVKGTISESDMKSLTELENLHELDLSEAEYTGASLVIEGTKLCSLKLPKGEYGLTLKNNVFLGGELTVPEGVSEISCSGSTFLTAVTLPSTLKNVGESSFDETNIVKADLSACRNITEFDAFSGKKLKTILLPPNLKKLILDAPVENIELPSTLTELDACDWNVETLSIPSSLEVIQNMKYMLNLKSIDFSNATSLKTIWYIQRCPLVTEIDLRKSPLEKIYEIYFDEYEGEESEAESKPQTRLVVSGPSNARKPVVWSSLKTLKLPSTLVTLERIVDCDKLTELNLYECTSLKTTPELQSCTALTTLKLPSEIEEVGDFRTCTALRNIYSAANTSVPTFTKTQPDSIMQKITLTVPNGCQGKYAMAAGWGECSKIVEGGYVVRLATQQGGVTLEGAGLYAEGSAATVSAPSSVPAGLRNYALDHWDIGGESYTDAQTTFTPNDHVTAEAFYNKESEPCFENADATITITADSPCTMTIYYGSGTEIACKENDYTTNNQGKADVSLASGENKVALALKEGEEPTYLYIVTSEQTKLKELNLKDLSSIKRINLDNCITEDFNPSSFTNLEYLTLNNNGITSLDLTHNEGLRRLSCTGNALTTLTLAKGKLESVNLYGCELASLDVSGCTALASLSCSYNALTSLDVSGCTALASLSCSGNALTSLDVSDCTALASLSCSDNALTSLDVSNCTALASLSCDNYGSGVKISTLTLGGDKLETLSCNNNEITSLDLRGQSSLKNIYCNSNELTELDLSENEKIEEVWCCINKIQRIVINDNAPLTYLAINWNSFAFSQVTPKMYSILKQQQEEYYYTHPDDVYIGGVLDLSKELTAYDGTPVEIAVKWGGETLSPDAGAGKYTVGNATYQISITCSSMPNIKFFGIYNPIDPTGIESLSLDGMKMTIDGTVVSVSNMENSINAVLYDTAGCKVSQAQGKDFSLNAPHSGIYILRLSDAQGRSSAIKLMMK